MVLLYLVYMDYDFLEKYLKIYRPSGYERDGAEFFAEECVKNGCDMEFIDKMWNSCVSVGSTTDTNPLKILISGHSDQNCLMVSEITKNGFVKYITMGGISPKTVIDSDFFILTNEGKKIKCFCSYKAIHLESKDDRKKCPDHKDLVLDLGCRSRESVLALGVNVGDLVVFDNSGLDMNFGEDGNYIVGSGLDDGVACGIVYEVMKNLDKENLKERNIKVYGACITSEETGCRGVGKVVRKIQPDISIDIDVCHDCSTEVGKCEGSQTCMGDGVVIEYGPEKYRLLNNRLKRLCDEQIIKYQIVAGKAGGTDTNNIQMFSDDCESTLLSIPCRYMHSGTHEMVNKKDLNSCYELINMFLKEVE